MAIHLIPVISTEYDYTMSVVLDGLHYVMHVYWNDRGMDGTNGAWYFDMATADERPIVSGVKIVLGAYLGRVSPEPPFTTGVITAAATSDASVDPGRDDLGRRVLLFYIPATDLLAIFSGIADTVAGV